MSKILASLAFCIMLAAMAGPVLATGVSVESMDMQPVSPEAWDDITCHAVVTDDGGSLDHVRFSWLRNGVGIRYFEKDVSGYSSSVSDRLDSSLTKEGDQIRCRVEAFSPWSHDSDEMTVLVRETSQNSPPVINGVPDQVIEIGDTVQVDMWEYSSDSDDGDSSLDFSLASQGNTDIIQCWISGDRFLYCGQAKQLGNTALTVRVTDPHGAWDTDTFKIIVTSGIPFPDNHPPAMDFVDIDPNSPDKGDDLTCEVRVSDDDGNLDNVEFRWYVDGSLKRVRTDHVSGFVDTATDVLDSSATDENDDVECRVTVEDSDGEEDSGSKSVRVEEEYDEDTCRIDVRDLEVQDGEDIEFVIRNTGTRDADVEYRIYVDGDRVELDSIDVDEDDSERVRFRWFDFEEGDTYDIRVRAEADCGTDSDTDETSVRYTILDTYDCDYGWLDSYRCSGDWIQRLYRDSDCDTAWRSWKHCTYGCSAGGVCLSEPKTYPDNYPPSPATGCSFAVDSFSHSQSVAAGGTGFVEAVIRNSGSRTQDFDMDIYLDGSYLGTKSFILSPGTSTRKVWNFNVPAYGTHRVAVVVSSDCGSTQTREGVINAGSQPPSYSACNYNGVCEAGESFLSCPYDCPDPGKPVVKRPTSVEITPASLDVPLYKSKVITIGIESSVPQEFRIAVAGIPDSWVSFKDTVSVDGNMFAYVFVNPRERGSHEMAVSVFAVKEGLTFSESVRVFVTEQDDSGNPQGDPLTGFATAIAGNVWAIMIIIIIAAAVLVVFSYHYLRDEDDVTFENMEKRDVLTS